MSELLFLTGEDFTLQNTPKGKVLTNSLSGFSLIMFYSMQCNHSKVFFPIFTQLPASIGGCLIGIVNVNKNKKLVQDSLTTITPITYVPYIVLYIKGQPYMKYQGPPTVEAITKFVFEVSKKVNARQKFSDDDKTIRKPRGSKIPEYTIGEPLYGDGKVTYLEFDEI